MAGEWRESNLGELIEAGDAHLQTGPFGTALKAAEYSVEGVPLISVGEVRQGHFEVSNKTPRVSVETTKRLPKFVLEVGDIVFGRKGGVDRNAIVHPSQQGWFLGSDGIRLRLAKKYSSLYFSYQMRSPATRAWLMQNCEGTTMPSLNQEILGRIPIVIPPLAEQKAIAAVLGSLDDKIELNRRMNETLEGMARALFQSWFVDFDPVRAKLDGRRPAALDPATAALFPATFQDSVLGHIPTSWKAAEIGQIADVIDCLHAKKPERCEEGKLYLQLNNICDDGLIDITDSFFISAVDYQKWISRMEANEGDCVITNVGRVGAVGQIPQGVKAALGRNITGIRCRTDFPFPTFLIECLASQFMREEIRLKTDSGTILDALNVKSIPKLRFVCPPCEIVARFETLARPLRRRMEQIISESRTLATLRDTLLPKLLSGELSVA